MAPRSPNGGGTATKSRRAPANPAAGKTAASPLVEERPAPPYGTEPKNGTGRRHRDHAGARALTAAPRLRPYNDSYSAFVSTMKVALPLLALILVGLVLMLPQFDKAEKNLRASIKSQIKAQDLENLYMVNARYVGTDEKNRSYTLTADSARQVSTDSDLVALEGPKAAITTEDGHKISMRANAGAFYRKARTLVLFGNVHVFHDDGYTFKTNEMELDLNKGSAKGSKPVLAHGPLGILRAKGFEVLDKGQTVLFTGKARLTIFLKEGQLKGQGKLPSFGGKKSLKGGSSKGGSGASGTPARTGGKTRTGGKK